MYKVGQKLISEIRTSRTQKSATRFKKVSDSVNLTAKSNLAKCGQEINPIKNFFNHLYLKLINPKKMSFKFFKETGGHFEGNVAFFKEKRFTGDIVKKAGNKTYLLKYEDGLIQKSITIPKNSREPRLVKAYKYECGKLKQIPCLLSKSGSIPNVLYRTDIIDKEVGRYIFDESETRYARMTRIPEAEVPKKINEAYEEICKQKGIDETVMPKLFVIKKRSNRYEACYSKIFNAIFVFSPHFKNMTDIKNAIEHELTHYQVELNFARVPKNEYNEHLQNVLLNSIGTTEPLEVNLNGWPSNKIVKVPMMSKK